MVTINQEKLPMTHTPTLKTKSDDIDIECTSMVNAWPILESIVDSFRSDKRFVVTAG